MRVFARLPGIPYSRDDEQSRTTTVSQHDVARAAPAHAYRHNAGGECSVLPAETNVETNGPRLWVSRPVRPVEVKLACPTTHRPLRGGKRLNKQGIACHRAEGSMWMAARNACERAGERAAA